MTFFPIIQARWEWRLGVELVVEVVRHFETWCPYAFLLPCAKFKSKNKHLFDIV